MATILLTDEEYNHIQGHLTETLGKIPSASPRAATHYSNIAKMHADFLAEEDAKRAKAQKRSSTRENIQQAKQARRNGTGAATTGPQAAAPGTGARGGQQAKAS